MKVLITEDVQDWALGALTRGIMKHLDRFKFIEMPVHPREYAQGAVNVKFFLDQENVDIWHCMYWNSGERLFELVPKLKEMPRMLSHHNHHSLNEADWTKYDAVIAPTMWSKQELEKKHSNVRYIPYGIDLDTFSYIQEYPPKEPRIGYVGRVMPHKNLDKVAKGAKELGYKVIGSGYIDDPKYWGTIDKSNIEFNGGIGRGGMMPKQFKDELYRQMSVFVMYSTGEKETGTLPLLEAMARGVPVMATWQGMARDIIEDGKNGIIFTEENFVEKLKMVMEDEGLRKKLRENAWQTIKNYPEQRMAWEYGKMYYKTVFKDQPVISIVIPTFNRMEELGKLMASIEANSYKAKEIIVCDDGSTDKTRYIVNELREHMDTPVKYIRTGDDPAYYGLAQARNMGAIEAMGDILMFMDDRYTLEKDALEKVAKATNANTWSFGAKIIHGKLSEKTAFIENFAWIKRSDFFKAGMFNERMNKYGGLSQETRHRFGLQGFKFQKYPDIIATETRRSTRNKKKDETWKMKWTIAKMYNY